MKDYYDILGIPRDASAEDIKRAYKILAHQFHPDKYHGNEKRFKDVNEAYRILSYDDSRTEYDKKFNQSSQSSSDHHYEEPIPKSSNSSGSEKIYGANRRTWPSSVKNLFTARGRINRLNYFLNTLFLAIISSVILLATEGGGAIGASIFFAASFCLVWINICAVIKRFHDLDKSGNNVWLGLIPLYNIYIGIMLLSRRGTVGVNRYGEDSLGNSGVDAEQSKENEAVKVGMNKKSRPADNRNGLLGKIIIASVVVAALVGLVLFITAAVNDEDASSYVTCKDFTYSAYGNCQSSGKHFRSVLVSSPYGCFGGNPVTEESCIYNAAESITNPDYLKNKSAYVIDEKGITSSSPAGKTIWVEEVIDSHTLKISYSVDNVGEKILKMKTLPIPWLGDPAGDKLISEKTVANKFTPPQNTKCWEDGAREYLKNYVLHSWVYLLDSGRGTATSMDYIVYFTDGTTDNDGKLIRYELAYNMIKNGYGVYEKPWLLIHNLELEETEKVASLGNRGLWGQCKTK